MTFRVSPNSNVIVDGCFGLNLSDSGYGKVAGSLEHANEYSATISYSKILHYVKKY